MKTYNVMKTDNLNDWHVIATGFTSELEAIQWTMHLVRDENTFYDFPEVNENGDVDGYFPDDMLTPSPEDWEEVFEG